MSANRLNQGQGLQLANRTKDGVANMSKKGIYQHGHPGVLKGVHGAGNGSQKCGKQLVSCGRGGQLVVQSWSVWEMQWGRVMTVRHTVTRKNGGCCTRLMTRAGNGVALCQAVRARRLPLNRGRPCGKGCRCVWRKRRQLGRELPCHGLGSDRHLRGIGIAEWKTPVQAGARTK